MPDIYTPRPDIVMRFLKEAGFESQVQPTILKDRPRDITYRFRTGDTYVEFYVHDIKALPEPPGPLFEPASAAGGALVGAALTAAVGWWFVRRRIV
ncbi:hypothetical protein [Gloeobacter morelensis]|uniref:Uncharacterized protein n=1 Tax=Gloeobacter morelensis MG652769 TaxID=2781736 RepID=A0ABY3PT81_9CYAN|nr:hypothetical protein [Gloeobacter morelensis]UFP96712.1 hypothetical protein ISF26_11080 [Gloeobacter morelensis MG652769]